MKTEPFGLPVQDSRVLVPEWFQRDTTEVAKELVGCLLCRQLETGEIVRARITETEAYLGITDAACHTFGGRKTPRTQVMYGDGGHFYVYQTYGMHFLLNVITQPAGVPEGVLLRAAMAEGQPARWLAGPALLTRGLCVDKSFYGKRVSPGSALWIEQDGCTPPVIARPRIGIDYAGEAREWPLRFCWEKHPSLSRP